jgi:hypothetical protein
MGILHGVVQWFLGITERLETIVIGAIIVVVATLVGVAIGSYVTQGAPGVRAR